MVPHSLATRTEYCADATCAISIVRTTYMATHGGMRRLSGLYQASAHLLMRDDERNLQTGFTGLADPAGLAGLGG